MKLININVNKYFHMIPSWKSPIKLRVELPVEQSVCPNIDRLTIDRPTIDHHVEQSDLETRTIKQAIKQSINQ